MKPVYDCIVIGGGPAGSTAAALLAGAGWNTLLLEAARQPRFHVGESLMPECYWIFERLGVLERMKNSSFVRKSSLQWISHADQDSHWFHFREHDPRECSTTWQVERSTFDKLLFDNAAEHGAHCFDQARVERVLFNADRAIGVRLQWGDERPRDVAARVIVDASGQQAVLADQLKLRVQRSGRSNVAIWGYYRNAIRDTGDDAGATLLLHTLHKRSWFWFIPLSNNITSIGVLGDQHELLRDRGSPAGVFEDELVDCPGLTERLLNAELVSELRMMKQFSYCTTQRSGPGWVLVGDAAGFNDPIYSAGVFLAMKSGEMAADAIHGGLRRDELSAEQLGRWTAEFDNGARWLRKLSDALYSPDFHLGRFLREHPQHRGNLMDLLMGRVFQAGAGKLFEVLA